MQRGERGGDAPPPIRGEMLSNSQNVPRIRHTHTRELIFLSFQDMSYMHYSQSTILSAES